MSRLRSLLVTTAEPNKARFALGSGIHALSESAFLIAALLAAHQMAGVSGVGLVGFVRVAPAALMAPFSSSLADRYGRRTTLLFAYMARAALLSLTGLCLQAGLPMPIFLVAITAVALVSSVIRPAQWALPPLLASHPKEITTIMTAWTTSEGLGTIVGPALSGVLVGLSGPPVAVWMSAVAAGFCGYLTARMAIDERRIKRPFDLGQFKEGINTVIREPGPRLVIGLLSTQTLIRGVLNVLIVASAVGLLAIGESGAGYLAAALGVGGLIGGIATISFADKDDLGTRVAISLFVWGTPILVIGVLPQAAVAALMIGLVGLGNALLDVSALTLLQRVSPPHALARVFGVLEGMVFLCVSLGSLLAPILIRTTGIRMAHVITGSVLPVASILSYRALHRLDLRYRVPEDRLEMLKQIPFLSALPGCDLATLAIRMHSRKVSAGEQILKEGTPGETFFIIESGEVMVTRDRREVATLHEGDYFGEIALTRDVPRVASVRAMADTKLLSLERQDFIGTVVGNPQGAAAVEAVVRDRLDEEAELSGDSGTTGH